MRWGICPASSIYPSMFTHCPFLLPPSILFLLFCFLLFCFFHHLHDVSILISIIGLLITVIFGGWVFNYFLFHSHTHSCTFPSSFSTVSFHLSFYFSVARCASFRFRQPSYSSDPHSSIHFRPLNITGTNILWHTIAILKRIEKMLVFYPPPISLQPSDNGGGGRGWLV